MSAAADDPAKAAARVSVVASIGYCAFLGGPPLIGFLGDHITVLRGLTAVAVLLLVAIGLGGSLRPLAVGTRHLAVLRRAYKPSRSMGRPRAGPLARANSGAVGEAPLRDPPVGETSQGRQ
jgi:hypothetical protein